MVANEAALILKVRRASGLSCSSSALDPDMGICLQYFGRAVSVGSKPVQEGAYKLVSPATVASTWERVSRAPKRPLLLAQAELNNDANRMLAFQQMQGRLGSQCVQKSMGPPDSSIDSSLPMHQSLATTFAGAGSNSQAPAPSQPTYTQSHPDNSRSVNQDSRYARLRVLHCA